MAELAGEHPAELSVDVGSDPSGAPVLALHGELDSSNAAALQGPVDEVVARRAARVIFDLAGLHFIDSAGIAILISAARVATVEVRSAPPIIERVLRISGLAGLLHLDP